MMIDKPLGEQYSAYRRWRIGRFTDLQRRRRPIIMLGTQKTGSTAIAALLAFATRRSVTLDLIRAIRDPEWQLRVKNGSQEFASVAYRYRREFKREIIKEPSLTYFAKELRQLYPRAKFVMIQRHPLETIRSVLNRLKIPGDLVELDMARCPELVRVPAWQLAMDSTWLGRPCQNYIESLAHRWDLAAQEYLINEQRYILIKYEDFVNDKQTRIEMLANDLMMPVKHDIRSKVDIQFQPKGHAVDFTKFFGPSNIDRIRKICGESGNLLGYEI